MKKIYMKPETLMIALKEQNMLLAGSVGTTGLEGLEVGTGSGSGKTADARNFFGWEMEEDVVEKVNEEEFDDFDDFEDEY